MAWLAIDQGTTSTRALRLEADGTTTITHVVEHRQSYPRSGWVEHDPEELLANVRACAASAGRVDGIGIDNQGESCLAWDALTGEAVSPVVVWQDSRTAAETEALKAAGQEPEVLARCGLPLDPYFSASKLAWLYRNVPAARELHRRGRLWLGTTDAWFLQRLTGHCVTDVTTASRTALMSIATGTWDTRLAELFGVPIDTLPPIVPTTGDFGAMDIDGRGVPVRASIVDQQAALYGHGCRAAGDAKITFGTGAFALAVTGNEPLRAPEKGLLPTVAWQRDGEAASYAIDGAVYTASAAVNWARGLGLFEHFDEIGAFDGPPAIERGLVFVPALTGLACPHWDRAARGTWLGLSLDTTRLDLVRAILEGVAMRAAEVLRAMHALVPRGGVVSIDGGLTRNPCFCQFLADAVGQPVRINDDAELTALGTARLVAESLGAVVATGGSTHVVEPRALAAGCHERFAEAVAVTRRWPLPAEAR